MRKAHPLKCSGRCRLGNGASHRGRELEAQGFSTGSHLKSKEKRIHFWGVRLRTGIHPPRLSTFPWVPWGEQITKSLAHHHQQPMWYCSHAGFWVHFLNRRVILSIKLFFCCLKKNILTKRNLWNKEHICAHGYGRLDVRNIWENVVAKARAEGLRDHILTAHRKQCENWKVGPGYEPCSPVLPPKGSLTPPQTAVPTRGPSVQVRGAFLIQTPHPSSAPQVSSPQLSKDLVTAMVGHWNPSTQDPGV